MDVLQQKTLLSPPPPSLELWKGDSEEEQQDRSHSCACCCGEAHRLESKQPTNCIVSQIYPNQDVNSYLAKCTGYYNRRAVIASSSGITVSLLGITTAASKAFSSEKPKSDNNIGGIGPWFIGSVVFGFLFWQKHRARIKSDTDLQNTHTRIKLAEAELCCKTNSAIKLKKEKEHALREAGKDQQEKEALLYQIINSKLNENELRQQLEVEIQKLHNLTNQENNLKIACKEFKDAGISLSENYNKEHERRQMLENELLAAVSPHTLAEVFLGHREMLDGKENVLEGSSSVDLAEAEKLEQQKLALCRSLEEKDSTIQILTVDLVAVHSKNTASDRELTELQDQLTSEGQLFRKKMAMLKGTSESIDFQVGELTSKLDEEQEKMKESLTEVNNLVEENHYLVEALNEKQNLVKQLKSQLGSISQMLCNFDQKTLSLNKELMDYKKLKEDLERMYEELESKSGSELVALSKVVKEEKAMATALEEDLCETKQALEKLKMDLDNHRQKMNSLSMCYEQLKEEISSTRENHRLASLSHRKEKRMYSTAKKRLDSSKLVLEEQDGILRNLKESLLQTTNLLQESRDRLSSLFREMEDVNAHTFLLKSEIFSLQDHHVEENITTKETNETVDKERKTKQKRTRREAPFKNVKKVRELPHPKEPIYATLGNASISGSPFTNAKKVGELLQGEEAIDTTVPSASSLETN